MEQTLNQPQTLCIKHLAKNYSKRWVVKDVSFSMQSGQIVGLLGPNGAGKSTTLKMITGYLTPTSGDVIVNGLNIQNHQLEVQKQIDLHFRISNVFTVFVFLVFHIF